MKWHDCKTDPPKKAGCYLLVYSCYDGYSRNTVYSHNTVFGSAVYSKDESTWFLFDMGAWTSIQELSRFKYDIIPIKWTEVESEEEQ